MKKVYLYRILGIVSIWIGLIIIALPVSKSSYDAFLTATGFLAVIGLIGGGLYLVTKGEAVEEENNPREE